MPALKGTKQMKYFLITLMLISIITINAYSELTSNDLLNIQKIVEETVDKSEKRIKEYIDIKIDGINTKFESVNTKIESVEERISLVTTLVYALIALIVLGIGIPQILIARKSSITNEQEKINQELRAEIETLKKQRIQSP